MAMLTAVRSITELERARHDLSAFMSHFRQQFMCDRLIAIWIDADFAEEPPEFLSAGSGSVDGMSYRVSKSAGLPHIWQLCWLEDIIAGPGAEPTRQDIFRALLASAPGLSEGKPGSLIPVLSDTSDIGELEREVRSLWAIGGEHLLPPWFQTATGALEPSGYTLADLGINL